MHAGCPRPSFSSGRQLAADVDADIVSVSIVIIDIIVLCNQSVCINILNK